MAAEPLLLVGLDEPESAELRRRLSRPALAFEMLPRIRVDRGRRLVELHYLIHASHCGNLIVYARRPRLH
jgi:hypothetical protein